MNKILLVLMCLFVACSQPSGAPTPSPVPSVSPPAVAATTAAVTDEGEGAQHPPRAAKPFVPKPDPRSAEQIAYAACKRADGSWACSGIKPLMGSGGPQIPPPSWSVPGWWLDFANSTGCASDANSGTSGTCGGPGVGPLLTVGQLYARWGTHTPVLNPPSHVSTITVMSSQPAGSATADPWNNFQASAPDGLLYLTGTPIAVGAPFAAGAITQISRGNPGNDFQVAGMGAALKGQLVFDSSVAGGSYAWVDVAGATASLSQPFAAAGLTTPSNTPTFTVDGAAWTIGDTLQLYTVPTIYLDALQVITGTMSARGNSSGTAWVQWINFGDPAGGPGGGSPNSHVSIQSLGGLTLSMVSSDCDMLINGFAADLGGTAAQQQMVNCNFSAGSQILGSLFLVYGGTFNNNTTFSPLFQGAGIHNDTILHGSPNWYPGSDNYMYNVHLLGTMTIQAETATQLRAGTANGAVWGAGTLQVNQGGALVNRTGTTWTNTVLVNAMKLTSAGLTTGTVPAVGGTFTNNGVTQVDTAASCPGGTTAPCFPIGAPITWSLATVGGTPCLAGGPYFSAANTANNFFTKAATANCNDVYNWVAGPTAGVTITSAAIDQYGALYDAPSGARFTN